MCKIKNPETKSVLQILISGLEQASAIQLNNPGSALSNQAG